MSADTGNPPAAVLAIDGGNSKTDVALVADDGTLLASVRGPGASHEDFGLAEAMRRLGELVRLAAGRANCPAGGLVARHTSACLAGADLPEEEAQLTDAVQRQGWSLTSAVANDTFAVLRAGLTPGDGRAPVGRRRHLRRRDQLRRRGARTGGRPDSSPSAPSPVTGAAASGSAARSCGTRPGPRTAAASRPRCATAVAAFFGLPDPCTTCRSPSTWANSAKTT